MRKQAVNILLSVTMMLCTFLAGFFFGRYYNDAPVLVSHLVAPAETTVPTVTTFPAETTVPAEISVTTTAAKITATETIPPATEAKPKSQLININTATAAQLETLPGIGEVIAQRIVDYRNEHGPFQSVYALTNVKGIGEKRLADLIHLITV